MWQLTHHASKPNILLRADRHFGIRAQIELGANQTSTRGTTQLQWGSLRRGSMAKLGQALVPGLSPPSKLDKITAPKLGQDTTADDDPKACQEIESDLYYELSSNSQDRDVDDMMASFQPCLRGMAGKVAWRRRRNPIAKIKNANGVWCSEPRDIEGIVVPDFETGFSSSNPDDNSIEAVLSAVSNRVTNDMNRRLLQPFREDEIVLGEMSKRGCVLFLSPPDPMNWQKLEWVVIRDARGHFVAGLSKKIKANGHLCMQSAWQLGRLSFFAETVLEGDSS
ncbi:hypothetical protein Acr_17g0007460 [Actinidia rufa]|uniref:Uncharacterized protein n=1 Tax=Actinidia rufa TaxID=165716 RepID=A0A7J0G315_9ERIC|nr:hypothetical protein Acr_17g0007460 [Actinidia rufa]